jgi:phosphopantothenoylcysteine decarboxylase/phosphopantothenate--cysteine ligase
MICVVTAGPTYEPLDDVRRLTNFSTGRLGTELADYLVEQGHTVTLLLGEQATYRVESRSQQLQMFSTTADLCERLKLLSRTVVDVVFHVAAVCDYTFGRIWVRSESGEMVEVRSGKISTRDGVLLTELVPTPKIIADLREWYPQARLVGWKFEVEGDRESVLGLARQQLAQCRTTLCVVNGRAYGEGFGLVNAEGKYRHAQNMAELFEALGEILQDP